MADSLTTLLDIVKMNGSDAVVGLIDETAKGLPELTGQYNGRQIPGVASSRTIKGIHFKTLVRSGLPTVGFRAANQGVDASKSIYYNKLVEAFCLNPRWYMDVVVADKHEDGAAAALSLEAGGQMQAALQAVAKQFYYGTGTGGDAAGHQGLVQLVDSSQVVDATGSTADTGSSAYMVKFGPRYCQWVYGNNGNFKLSDIDLRDYTDASSKKYTAYFQELMAYVGLSVQDYRSIVRIKKLTADSGKGLTDALLADALGKFPLSLGTPDAIFMSKRSWTQLKKSRTATNPTGTPAPYPVDYEGIPIVPTESILDTEALTL